MVPRPWAQVKVFSLHIAFHPLILGAQGKKAKRRHLIKGDVSFPGTSTFLTEHAVSAVFLEKV